MKTVIKLQTNFYKEEDVVPLANEELSKHFASIRDKIMYDVRDNTIGNTDRPDEIEEHIQKLTDERFEELNAKYNADTPEAKLERDAYDREAVRIACNQVDMVKNEVEEIAEYNGIVDIRNIKYEGEMLEVTNVTLDIDENKCIISSIRNKLI